MPAFSIVDNGLGKQEDWVYNDRRRWTFSYIQYSHSLNSQDDQVEEDKLVIAAIPCDEMIKKMDDLTEPQREAYYAEFPQLQTASGYMCPDIESFDILGGFTGKYHLNLEITATDISMRADSLKKAMVLVNDISTIFEPEAYTESGYEQPVTLREKMILPDKDKSVW